jgi:DNA-binding response OmpR family regulator
MIGSGFQKVIAMARILIVEDDLDLVETYTDLLETQKYTVISAGRAADAIQLMTRHKPHVIILDLNLPGDSGVTVINIVRTYAALKATKIIVASGFPEKLRGSQLESRVDVILSKPVDNRQLLSIIEGFDIRDTVETKRAPDE